MIEKYLNFNHLLLNAEEFVSLVSAFESTDAAFWKSLTVSSEEKELDKYMKKWHQFVKFCALLWVFFNLFLCYSGQRMLEEFQQRLADEEKRWEKLFVGSKKLLFCIFHGINVSNDTPAMLFVMSFYVMDLFAAVLIHKTVRTELTKLWLTLKLGLNIWLINCNTSKR